MRVAIALFPRNTALDAIGPYEVPGATDFADQPGLR
jgi:hypothetical protein